MFCPFPLNPLMRQSFTVFLNMFLPNWKQIDRVANLVPLESQLEEREDVPATVASLIGR